MIEIRVCRGGAVHDPPRCDSDDAFLNWGEPIYDALLCTEDVAIERGRVEVDGSYSNRLVVGISIPRAMFIQQGSLISITSLTDTKIGMLRSVKVSASRSTDSVQQSTNLTLEMLA